MGKTHSTPKRGRPPKPAGEVRDRTLEIRLNAATAARVIMAPMSFLQILAVIALVVCGYAVRRFFRWP